MEDREPIAPGDYRYYEPAKPDSLKRAGLVIPNSDNRKSWCDECRQLVSATYWLKCEKCDGCSWPLGGIERVDGTPNAEVSEVAVADATKTSGARPPLSLD